MVTDFFCRRTSVRMSFCWERDMASISIGFGDNRHKFYSL